LAIGGGGAEHQGEAQLVREAAQLREGGTANPYGLRVAEAKKMNVSSDYHVEESCATEYLIIVLYSLIYIYSSVPPQP
jgi:hypothetical protein